VEGVKGKTARFKGKFVAREGSVRDGEVVRW
jgi:hypothetical protein